MTQPTPHLNVRTATDILDAVPTLLGFIPTESLVVIYLDTGNHRRVLAMTARLDLPTTPQQLASARQLVEHHGTRHDTAVLVAYTSTPQPQTTPSASSASSSTPLPSRSRPRSAPPPKGGPR